VTSTLRSEQFDVFFDRMWKPSVGLASRIVGSADAQDMAVEAFARALDRWDRVCDLPHLDAWLLRVTTNVALDRLRHARFGAPPPDAEPGRDEDAMALKVTMQEALRRLPRRQGEVVTLRFLGQLNEPEVAAALGISLGTVKTHARRGLAALRRRLGDQREELFHVD